ncbi:MAG: LOG family protein [Candidatus Kapaibacterium sp.]
MPVITVFGSAQCSAESFEYRAAELLGQLLGDNGFDVATGGYGGVMEAALKGASGAEVRRIGVTTPELKSRTRNDFVGEEIVANTYLKRLETLVNIGDAYVVLPGGTGTLMELAATLTLRGKHLIPPKKIICFGEQWNEVIQTMAFYSERTLDFFELLDYVDKVEEAIELLTDIKDK